jgi:hypothetical protein
MLELREEALDQISTFVQPFAEARLPLSVGLGRNVWCGPLILNQNSYAIGVVSLVCEDDGTRIEVVSAYWERAV